MFMAKTFNIIQWSSLLKLFSFIFISIQVLIGRANSSKICGDGFDLLTETCYRIHQSELTWDEAYLTCQKEQSHLVQMQDGLSQEEREILFEKLNKVSEIWTSLRRKQGYFQWLGKNPQILRKNVNDTDMSIWGGKEPPDLTLDCASVQIGAKKLFAQLCDRKLPFVCLRPQLTNTLETVPFCDQGWLGHILIPNRCLLSNTKSMSWNEAESYCRNKNATLLTESSYEIIKSFTNQLDPFNDGLWLQNFKDDCIISVSSNKVSCDQPARSVCEMNPNLENLNVRLIVAIRNKRIEEPVIWMDRNDMKALTLICLIEIPGIKLNVSDSRLVSYSWMKNGIYMNSSSQRLIFPNHWRTPSPFQISFGNITHAQGTFRCEVSLLGLQQRFTSKDVTILLKETTTSMVNITLSMKEVLTPNDIELTSAPIDRIIKWNKIIHNVFSDITSRINGNFGFWWALQYIRPIDSEVSLKSISNIVLTGIVSTANLDNNIIKNTTAVNTSDMYTIVEISTQNLDRCPDEKYSFNNFTYEWNMELEKSETFSNPKCLSRTPPHRIVPRYCLIDYVTGINWEPFDYNKCLNSDGLDFDEFCPFGFHPINNETCIKGFTQKDELTTYYEAQNECTKDNAILSLPLDDANLYPPSGLWMTRETNGEVLLKNQSNFFFSDSLCLSYIPKEYRLNKIFRDCNESLPFICSRPRMMNSLSEVPWCHQGWLGSDWPGLQDSCFFFHYSQDTNRSTAFERCQSRGAHLAIAIDHPTKESLMNTVRILKQERLISTDSGAFWIGLMKTISGIYWNSSTASYIDRDLIIPTNNSGGMMGILTVEPIQFLFTKSVNKFGYICQKPALNTKERPPRISLRKVEYIVEGVQRIKLICDGRRVHPNSFVYWYLNGDLMTIDSRINGNDDVISSKKRILPNGKIIAELEFPLKNSIRQGQYHCEIRGSVSIPAIISNKVLVVLPGSKSIILFVETVSSDEDEFEDIIKILNDCLSVKIQVNKIRIFTNSTIKEFYVSLDRPANESEFKSFKTCLGSMKQLKSVKKLEYRSPNLCQKEKSQDEVGNILDWPSTSLDSTTLPNQVCFSKNGTYASRQCLGDYVRGAKWGEVHGSCDENINNITLSLRTLSKSNITHDSVDRKSSKLLYLTKSAETLQPIDILHIADTMQKIANVKNVTEEIFSNAAKTIDCILRSEDTKLEEYNLKSNYFTRITDAFEKILENVQFPNNSNLQLSLDSMYVQSYVPSSVNPVVGVAFMNEVDGNEDNRQRVDLRASDHLNLNMIDAALLLPMNLLEHLEHQKPNDRVTFIVYDSNRLFPAVGDALVKQKISSRIVSAKVPRTHNHRLNPPVTLVFRLLKSSLITYDHVSCVFWDYVLNNGRGDWSEEGCWVSDVQNERIVCQCNHLTNFAVLMDIDDQYSTLSEKHRLALDLITYIGCSLSIFGLVLTIITFASFKKWRKKDGNKVLCNLSVALLVVLVTFLAGIEQVDTPGICIAVAVLLHYFLLATFCWMLVEAVLQYLMFVRVFDTYIPRFMIKAMSFAWGVPLLIVGIILSIDVDLYRGKYMYCWMSLQAQYFGFLLPLGIIVTINTIVFIRVLKGISCDRTSALRSNQSKRQLAIVQLNAATCIFVLLGLSWIFGFMTISKTDIVFHYLFCICNSLQGLSIFIFMVVRDKNAKDLWYAFLSSSKRTKPNLMMSSVRSTSSTGTKSNGHIRRS